MILNDLFMGKIYPLENVVSESDEYKNAKIKAAELVQDLSTRLSDQDRKVLNDIQELDLAAHGCQIEEFFKYGFALGVLMMQEIYGLRYFRPDE